MDIDLRPPARLGSFCSACLAPGTNLQRCARCKNKWYCGVECQTKHWTGGHKDECRGDTLSQVRIDNKSLDVLKDREGGEFEDIARSVLGVLASAKAARGESMSNVQVFARRGGDLADKDGSYDDKGPVA